jgi:hypothetical protein
MRGSAQFLDGRGLLVDLILLALIQFGNFVNAGLQGKSAWHETGKSNG